MLDLPDLAGLGVQREALRIAVAPGEDLRPRARPADKGIVRRHRAVVLQAHDLAGEIAEILRAQHLETVADTDIHQPGAVEDDARAEIEAALAARPGFEDRPDIDEPAVAQFGAGDGRRGAVAVARDIGKIKGPVLREARMQADIEQARLASGAYGGHARQRPGFQPAVGEEAQPARPFGDQQAAVGQEGDAPGLHQVSTERYQPVGRLGAFQRFLGPDDCRRGKGAGCS